MQRHRFPRRRWGKAGSDFHVVEFPVELFLVFRGYGGLFAGLLYAGLWRYEGSGRAAASEDFPFDDLIELRVHVVDDVIAVLAYFFAAVVVADAFFVGVQELVGFDERDTKLFGKEYERLVPVSEAPCESVFPDRGAREGDEYGHDAVEETFFDDALP